MPPPPSPLPLTHTATEPSANHCPPPRNLQGIWRIPIDDIDRPGSFAAHMYRSVSLLVDVLKASDDFRTLFQLADWLAHAPDDDKYGPSPAAVVEWLCVCAW